MLKRLSQGGKQEMQRELGNLLDQFVYYAVPPPTCLKDGERFYRWGVEPKVIEALDTIINSQFQGKTSWRRTINPGDTVHLRLKSIEKARPYIPAMVEVDIPLPEDWPYPDAKMTEEDIPDNRVRAQILTYAVKFYRTKWALSHGRKYASILLSGTRYDHIDLDTHLAFDGVNTPGQLHRIWPEMSAVMLPAYRERVLNQRGTSQLPVGIDEDWVKAFRSLEHFDEVNNALLTIHAIGVEEVIKVEDRYIG